jgi:5'-AMP-activated protein kinase catalytic alpha subunit
MDNINDELNKPLSNISQYTLGEKLGEGTFGVVYLGTHILTKEKVAIKIIEKKKLRNEKDKNRLKREISILKKLHHINIINLYTTIETINQIY